MQSFFSRTRQRWAAKRHAHIKIGRKSTPRKPSGTQNGARNEPRGGPKVSQREPWRAQRPPKRSTGRPEVPSGMFRRCFWVRLGAPGTPKTKLSLQREQHFRISPNDGSRTSRERPKAHYSQSATLWPQPPGISLGPQKRVRLPLTSPRTPHPGGRRIPMACGHLPPTPKENRPYANAKVPARGSFLVVNPPWRLDG